MKNTPFTDKHMALGAKMAEFAGYNMPISYSGINDEHQTVRNIAGVFDVSHMGEFIIKGKGALELIQKVFSNDISKIKAGQAQYGYLPNEHGGIVDDMIIYCLEEEHSYMLVANASNIQKDWEWISKHNTENVEMINISDETGLLAVQGPKAVEILQPLTDMDLTHQKYFTFLKGKFADVDDVIISATGYTGSGGVEIYFEDKGENANKIWNAIFEAGANKGLKPIGLGARDTLRLEKGFCLYGNDIDENSSPLEAGLGWVTKFNKDFIAKDILSAQKEKGLSKKLVGLEMIDRGIPRHGYEIKNKNDDVIGQITSGTQSPSLGKAIAMAYVATDHAQEGSEIYVVIRDKKLKAKIVKMPFLK